MSRMPCPLSSGHVRAATLAAALPVLFVAMPALAHTGIGPTAGFAAGFVHPFSGPDHLLAMLGIGLLAARAGGRALWRAPATFLAFLVLGAALAFAGVPLYGVEAGIALSLAVFAGALLLPAHALPSAAPALIATFALFHGHAHGSEVPAAASGLAYAAGFVGASALLHVSGMALSALPGRRTEPLVRGSCALAMVITAAAGLIAA